MTQLISTSQSFPRFGYRRAAAWLSLGKSAGRTARLVTGLHRRLDTSGSMDQQSHPASQPDGYKIWQQVSRSPVRKEPLLQALPAAAREHGNEPRGGERDAREPPGEAILQVAIEEGLRRRDEGEDDEAEDPEADQDASDDHGRAGSAVAVVLHHQARAAARDVGDDRRAPVNLGHGAEVDGKGELHLLALSQAEVARLDEHAVCAQVLRLAELALAPRIYDVHRGAGSVASVQSAFHGIPGALLIVGAMRR